MSAKKTEEKKKLRPLRLILRILGGILAALLLVLLVMFIIPLTETGDQTPVEGSADWMARLDDSTPLDAVVIPGTHDSGTEYVQLAFFSKCQAKDVAGQLEAGYRYLDIRLGLTDGGFKLMHGFTNCKTGPLPWEDTLYLDAVLEQCYAFLKSHPTETVVFAVKKEHGDETAQAFAEKLEAEIGKRPELWYTGNELPTLGEARGKLVLLRRYVDRSLPPDAACAGVPLYWVDQRGSEDLSLHAEQNDNGSYRLWVQDRFEYGTEDKWTAFLNGLKEPKITPEDLSIHFLSTKGTWKYGHPYLYAKPLNARLLELSAEELRGWIILDFGDAALAEHIWSANFD